MKKFSAVKIKKNPTNVKFKVRCSRFLYTLVITDKEKAEKLKQSLPPGKAFPFVKTSKVVFWSSCYYRSITMWSYWFIARDAKTVVSSLSTHGRKFFRHISAFFQLTSGFDYLAIKSNNEWLGRIRSSILIYFSIEWNL